MRDEARSPTLTPLGSALLYQHHQYQLSHAAQARGQGQLSIVLMHQHVLIWQHRPIASMWSLVVRQALKFNTDLFASITTDLDTVLSNSPGPDVTIASGGHSYQFGLWCQYGLQPST